MVNPFQEVFNQAVDECAQDLYTRAGGVDWDSLSPDEREKFLYIARRIVRHELAKSGMV